MLLIFQYVELNCDASLTYTECILILEELRYTFSIRNKRHHAAAVFMFFNVMDGTSVVECSTPPLPLYAIITSMFLLTAVGRFAKGEPFKFALRVSIPAQAEEPGSDLQLLLYCGL